MVIVFALLAAFCNAANVVTQHMASISDPEHSSGRRLVSYLFHSPLWLFGWVALAGAFLFQALALHNGLVSVVQPLLATELVFALVLRQFWVHQSILPVTWGGAALTCVSLAVFVTAGEPRGGHDTPTSHHWLAAIVACAVGAGVLTVLAHWGSPGLRAAWYASAAAIMWALTATFIKATTDTLTQFGVAGTFIRWPVYALAAGGVAGTLLQQAALHVGPLRVSQPLLVIVDPVVSIALSVWLFDERFTSEGTVLALAAVAFAVMCIGVVILTQTAPATMQASPAVSAEASLSLNKTAEDSSGYLHIRNRFNHDLSAGYSASRSGSGTIREREEMPWVVRDVVNDINTAVARRWQGLDPLLPVPSDLPEGCMAPLLAAGGNGRPAGLGVCRHVHVPPDTLAQTWGAATKFVLTLRLRGPDTRPAADELLAQWHDHLDALPEAAAGDTAAVVNWPSRDVSGVLALLRHGLQPMSVTAARPAGRPTGAGGTDAPPGLVIRPAGPDDLGVVTEMEMGVIRYDGHFGGSIVRPATEGLLRASTRTALAELPGWTWLAELDGQPVGLTVVERPEDAAWIAGMTRPGATAYLATMFVRPDERGGGIGAALVKHAHDELDERGIDVTLLHYAQVNPLSAPFWHRMGYRPLWSSWETRPAASLR